MRRFGWRLATIIVLIGALTMPGAAATMAASKSSTALDGRLGGQQPSMEKRFGRATGQDDVISGLDYDTPYDGGIVIVVTYAHDVAIRITVRANPSGAAYAAQIARAFLPLDARCPGDLRTRDDGLQERTCRSAAVAEAFDAKAWKQLSVGGAAGDSHYLLFPDDGGGIYQIELDLGAS